MMTSVDRDLPLSGDVSKEGSLNFSLAAKHTSGEANGNAIISQETPNNSSIFDNNNSVGMLKTSRDLFQEPIALNTITQQNTKQDFQYERSSETFQQEVLTENYHEVQNNIDNQESGNKTRNEDKIKNEKNLELAASYIEDAMHGRTLEYNTDAKSLWYYRKYSNRWLQWMTLLFMWFLLILALFEDPAVVPLPFWATMIMELICLGVIMFRVFQLYQFVPRNVLIKDPKNIAIALTILVTLVDMIVYFGMIESNVAGQAIRVSRVFRPLFFINMNESKQVRRAFRNIRNTVPEIISVLVLFLFSIALFTLLAFKLFQYRNLYYRDDANQQYFVNYWDSFFDLYVLVTTANSPDVMMPAYDSSPWFALFFIAYIIINTYIFMNLFLAVIYNSYRGHLKTEIRSSVLLKRQKLEKAFEVLQDASIDRGIPLVSRQTWFEVMGKLTSPPSYRKIELYLAVLLHEKAFSQAGQDDKRGITKEKFLEVANLLNVNLVEDSTMVNLFYDWAPEVYMSRPSRFIRKCVNHKFFMYFFDVLIIANAICIGVGVESTEWFFLSIFILEILLKMYALGPREYFSYTRLWNWFDFIIIMSAFIATIVEASLDELTEFPREALDFLLVLRCLRLVKIVGSIERFQIIVMTILNITPSLLTYGVVLLMIYYSFAIVAMEAFGGKISGIDKKNCGNPKLSGSEFIRVGYCNNNFNDILHSLVTLVELTVVNQWHIITLGYTLVTSKAARIYFVCFHLIVVILIMNIIVAFVLEAFILEYSLAQTEIESVVEKTIEELGLGVDMNVADTMHDRTRLVSENEEDRDDLPSYSGRHDARYQGGPRRRFKINKGHKNVEVLLQRMFEGELGHETSGNATSTEQTLTLDGVTGISVTI